MLAWGGEKEEEEKEKEKEGERYGDRVCVERLGEWEERKGEEERKEMVLEWKPRFKSLKRGIEKEELEELQKKKGWAPW